MRPPTAAPCRTPALATNKQHLAHELHSTAIKQANTQSIELYDSTNELPKYAQMPFL